MAQIVKLRRSSVSGQKPTNSNLQLGELALNTTDGKVYMAKSGSLGPSIEELISTNTVNTGSLSITGAITGSVFTGSFIGDGSQLYNIPLSGVTNLVTISGSFDDRLDSLETYSGSQLVPSSSMSFRTLQTTVYCKNVSGAQINKGTVVRIVGSIGDNPLIGVADPTSEAGSANVLGIATVNIPNDDFGLVITEGVLTGVNTNGMTAGALLFLGSNGTFTTTPPTAPNHGVRLGEVLRIQQNQGSIYVRVDNGIELNEAHDVIYTTGITTGDLLIRSGSVWKNSKSLEGDYVVTGSLTLTQNLTVLGSSSLVYVTSSNLAVSASFISVNVFEPAERFGGLKVYDSGSSNATASLAWDSQHNHWVYQNVSGSQYSGGMLLSGPRNSGSLGDEPGLIDGRIVKSVGGDHLDVSIISETGTTINIDGNLVANSITGSFDFFGLINRPTLVSGSSQIDITDTTGYSTFSSSVKDRIDNVTGSITDLSSSVKDRIDTVTSSITDLSSSVKDRIDTVTSSIIYLSSSVKDRIDTVTSSVIYLSSSVKDRIDTVTGSITDLSSSVKDRIDLTTSSIIFLSSSVKDRIDVVTGSINNLSSSIATTTNNLDGRLDSIEGKTGSYATTGSNIFKGDQTITGSLNVTGDLYIGTGDINDRIVIKSYFSASIIADSDNDHYLGQPLKRWANIYGTTGSFNNLVGNSGSTINIYDAVITGSMTGSFKGDGSGLYNIPASGVTGLELNKIVSGSVSASIQSDGTFRVNGDTYIDGILTARELHMDYVTSSILYTSGSTKFGDTSDDTHQFTGSVRINGNLNVDSITGSIDYNNLTNVPTLVSGSSQISYTGITDIPNGIVSSSNQISYTGITNIPSGIVSGSQQVIDLGFTTTGSFESFTSSYTTHSSSFDLRINTITGSINNITSSLSHFELFSSSINNFTSSVVLTSQTSSMTVLSSSYALTASYALNGGGGGTEGRTAKLIQNSASTTWTFTHNLGEQYPAITIFNEFDDVVIPTSINAQDENTLIITFSSAQSGIASATVGGGLPYISGSYQGRVLAVDNNSPVWKSGIISGSLQLTNIGFATTGSNNFKGDQYVSGSIIIGNSASIGSKCVTISSTTQIVNLSPFDGANFDYVVKNGLNMRAGVIMSVWNGSNSVYNESSTMDLGNTSGVTFNVTSNGGLNAAVTSGTWTVEVLYRALGCGNLSPTPTPTQPPAPTSTPTPTPGSTNYLISSGYTISEPCNGLFGNNQTVYGDAADWLEVTRFYTNSGMTTPFNGNNLYYGDSVASYGTTLQIDSSGYVINSYAC